MTNYFIVYIKDSGEIVSSQPSRADNSEVPVPDVCDFIIAESQVPVKRATHYVDTVAKALVSGTQRENNS